MTEEISTAEKNTEIYKTPIERSAAYPGISIEDAIIFVESVFKNFPGSQHISREDIAAVLKKSVGAIQRDVGASVQYGFFDRDKKGYKVSDLFKVLHNNLGEQERTKCLLYAFGNPKLYSELIAKHDGHIIPSELRTHLIRFHKIVDKAASAAALLFVENAKYAGALNDNGILHYNEVLQKVEIFQNPTDKNTKHIMEAQIKKEYEDINNDKNPPEFKLNNSHPKEQVLLEEMVDSETITIKLIGGRFAILKLPRKLNSKDILILRKEIELLELLVE